MSSIPSPGAPGLNCLPPELVDLVLGHLDMPALLALRRSGRGMAAAVRQAPAAVWRQAAAPYLLTPPDRAAGGGEIEARLRRERRSAAAVSGPQPPPARRLGEVRPGSARGSADGRRLAAIDAQQRLLLADADGRRPCVRGDVPALDEVAWSPSGRDVLVFSHATHTLGLVDGEDGHVRFTQDTWAGQNVRDSAALSPDGRSLAWIDGAGRLTVLDIATQRSVQPPAAVPPKAETDSCALLWSADSGRLLVQRSFVAAEGGGGPVPPELAVYRAEEGFARQEKLAGFSGQPALSPNGAHLAFAVGGGMRVVALAGPQATQAYVSPGRCGLRAARWSADGGRVDLYDRRGHAAVSLDARTWAQLHQSPAPAPAFDALDGTYRAVAGADADGEAVLQLTRQADGRRQAVPTGAPVVEVVWSRWPQGRHLLAAILADDAVLLIDARRGKVVQALCPDDGAEVSGAPLGVTWCADCQHLRIDRPDDGSEVFAFSAA